MDPLLINTVHTYIHTNLFSSQKGFSENTKRKKKTNKTKLSNNIFESKIK